MTLGLEDYDTINVTFENSQITSKLQRNLIYVQKAHFSTPKCLDKFIEEVLLRAIRKKEKICLLREILKESPPMSAKRALFNKMTINNLNFATSNFGPIGLASICPLFSSLKTLTFFLI